MKIHNKIILYHPNSSKI